MWSEGRLCRPGTLSWLAFSYSPQLFQSGCWLCFYSTGAYWIPPVLGRHLLTRSIAGRHRKDLRRDWGPRPETQGQRDYSVASCWKTHLGQHSESQDQLSCFAKGYWKKHLDLRWESQGLQCYSVETSFHSLGFFSPGSAYEISILLWLIVLVRIRHKSES